MDQLILKVSSPEEFIPVLVTVIFYDIHLDRYSLHYYETRILSQEEDFD